MAAIIDASDYLHDITGGNPYFLRELLRELDEEPTRLDGNRALPETLATIAPAGVRALVDRRLQRLTGQAREVLDAAAVLGRDVTLDLLAGVCRVPHDVVFDALEESLAGRLLVEVNCQPCRLRGTPEDLPATVRAVGRPRPGHSRADG